MHVPVCYFWIMFLILVSLHWFFFPPTQFWMQEDNADCIRSLETVPKVDERGKRKGRKIRTAKEESSWNFAWLPNIKKALQTRKQELGKKWVHVPNSVIKNESLMTFQKTVYLWGCMSLFYLWQHLCSLQEMFPRTYSKKIQSFFFCSYIYWYDSLQQGPREWMTYFPSQT